MRKRWVPPRLHEPQPTRQQPFVYFIREGDDGPIKIGWAYSPALRRAELNIGNWRRLHVLGYVPGDSGTESRLHRRFVEWNIGGEWFSSDAPGLLELACTAGLIARAIEDGSDAISGALVERFAAALRLSEEGKAS